MVAVSISEILSIGAIIPFLAVLTSPEKLFNYSFLKPFFQAMGFVDPVELVLPFTIAFAIAAAIAGFMRLILIATTTKISYGIGSELSFDIYKKTLHQKYSVHIARNSSVIINAMSTKVDVVIGAIILNGLIFIANLVMIVAILCVLMTINLLITSVTFLSFAFAYLLIVRVIKYRLLANSNVIAYESVQIVKNLQEGMGAIRDILLGGTQDIYCDTYRKSDTPLRRAQGLNHFIANSPKFVMESFSLVFISVMAYVLVSDVGVAKAIPVIGMVGLGAQRLLPMLQQAYSTWVGMLSARGSLNDVVELLEQPLLNKSENSQNNTFCFKDSIELKNVCFRYGPEQAPILNKVNLKINKGSRVGFIGATGSGKTTLLDVLMGLLEPNEGSVEVDGVKVDEINKRSWQNLISHVPQEIFLTDSSIAKNIAFAENPNKINHERLAQTIELAQLGSFIRSLPQGLETIVGERGVQLSGGQRQRIGIARALYKRKNVIVFDEATSALDNDTEECVMNVVNNLSNDITVLIIAHRLSTLKACDKIFELHEGSILNILTYEEMIKNG